MFDMMSLSNDETERNNFFAQTLENSRVLIYLIFNEIQTSFSRCLIVVLLLLGREALHTVIPLNNTSI